MIQFNLLPDVKVQYIKAARTKRTVLLSSVLVAGGALALFVLLFIVVSISQKKHLANLDKDITSSKNELKAKTDLGKILTVQNQLKSLPALHNEKPVASRVFSYVQQVTPQKVSISSFTVSFKDEVIKIEGSADTLASVNTFADTLKFTNFIATSTTDSSSTDPAPAFTDVVLASFAVANNSGQAKGKPASFTITLKYKSDIFKSSKEIKLQVANKITTRSETEKPSIFESTVDTPTTLNIDGAGN